jgi:hypothetical protein
MDYSSWDHAVLESLEEEYRRYFQGRDVSKLNSREDVSDYSQSVYYRRRAHDLSPTDRGYTVFFDEVRGR